MDDAHPLFGAGGVGPVRGAGGGYGQGAQHPQPGQDAPGSGLAGQVGNQRSGPAPDGGRYQRRVGGMTQGLSRQCVHGRPGTQQPVQPGAERGAHPIQAGRGLDAADDPGQ